MKLRYIGVLPTSFLSPPVGSLEPGQEFQVTDEDAERLLARSDVEEVEASDGPSEDLSDQRTAESPRPSPEVTEDPTERQDDTAPAKPVRRRPATRTDSSGSADTTK